MAQADPADVGIPPHAYLTLINMPKGTFGISYDISTPDTERNLPLGWKASRCKCANLLREGTLLVHSPLTHRLPVAQTYRQLAIRLQHGRFARLQKSDWVRNETTAVDTYYTMLLLRNIRPPGKFQSTVQGLKMHCIDDWVYDVSDEVRLGGAYATVLAGPTPRGLVPPHVPAVQPPVDFPLPPQHT